MYTLKPQQSSFFIVELQLLSPLLAQDGKKSKAEHMQP